MPYNPTNRNSTAPVPTFNNNVNNNNSNNNVTSSNRNNVNRPLRLTRSAQQKFIEQQKLKQQQERQNQKERNLLSYQNSTTINQIRKSAGIQSQQQQQYNQFHNNSNSVLTNNIYSTYQTSANPMRKDQSQNSYM